MSLFNPFPTRFAVFGARKQAWQKNDVQLLNGDISKLQFAGLSCRSMSYCYKMYSRILYREDIITGATLGYSPTNLQLAHGPTVAVATKGSIGASLLSSVVIKNCSFSFLLEPPCYRRPWCILAFFRKFTKSGFCLVPSTDG
jgi:hypothetical protein